MPDSAIDILYQQIKELKEGCIVLCRSARAANLVKLQLMNLNEGRGLLGAEVLSLNSYVTRMAKAIGIEGQIIGSLGREMILSEILAEEKSVDSETISADIPLSDYVSGFNQAISDMKKAGISAKYFASKACQENEMQLLAKAYERYDKRLKEAEAIDITELMKKVSTMAGQNNSSLSGGASLIAFIPDIEPEVAKFLESFGADVFKDFSDDPPHYPISNGIIKLSARQGERLSREVARLIKRRHVDNRIGYEKICICVPSSGTHSLTVAAGLDWAGIPTSEPIWGALSDHPVGSSLLNFMELVSLSDNKIDAFKYCAAPYWGIDLDAVSNLRSFQKVKGTLMELNKWAKAGSIVGDSSTLDNTTLDDCLEKFNKWANQIYSWVQRHKKSNTWGSHCHNLREFIENYYGELFSKSLDPASMATGFKAIEGLYEIINKIEEANLLMKDRKSKVDWNTFSYSVSEAIRKTRIMKKAASILGVAIAEPKDIKGLSFDILVLYEATETNFPSIKRPKWLLSDEDLIRIAGSGKDYDEDHRIALERADLDAAIASCKGELVLAVPSIGKDERKINASVWVTDIVDAQIRAGGRYEFFDRLRKLPASARIDDCVTEAELSLFKSDYAYYEEKKPFGFEALKKRNLDEAGARLKQVTKKVLDENYIWSPSKLNGFLNCSLSAVTSILLNMGEDEEYEELTSGKAKGNLVHNALKSAIDVLKDMRIEGKATKQQAGEKAIKEMDRKLSYSESYKYADVSEEIWKLIIAGIRPALETFVMGEVDYVFNDEIGILPCHTEITLPLEDAQNTVMIDGMDIRCKARIDRIDMMGENLCAIYDYKTATPALAKKDVQIEFYAILCRKLLRYKPIASVYIKIEQNDDLEQTRRKIQRGFLVVEYAERLIYEKKTITKKPNVSVTGLLKFKEQDYDNLLSQYEKKIGNVIRDINEGKFLEGINPDERRCKYCQRSSFCWALRAYLQAEEAESAGELG